MGWMITHSELALDHGRYPRRRPDLVMEAEGLGSAGQQGRQLRPLLGSQLRLAAWSEAVAERLDSVSFGATHPLADRSGADPQRRCNRPLGPALLNKLPSAQPTTFAPISWWLCSC